MPIAQSISNSAASIAPTHQLGMVRRIIFGGKLSDFKRMPRYILFATLGVFLIWAPLLGYLKTAPLTYSSTTSLIMPGTGASASMNLEGIGQASSYANSAFSSNSVSPTETYKRLLGADRIVDAAAQSLGLTRAELGLPRVRLVDQTSLIHIEMTGATPLQAQQRGDALLQAFFAELDALRADEVSTREGADQSALEDYRASVAQTRSQISALQSESGLLSVKQYDALLDRHLNQETAILAQRAELNMRRASIGALEVQLGVDATRAALTLKLFADAGYLALLDEVARREVDLAEANAMFGRRHPKVQDALDARDQAALTVAQLAQDAIGLDAAKISELDIAPEGARADLLSDLVRKQVEFTAAQEESAALEAQLSEGQAEIDQLARTAAQLQDLERNFSVAEAVFSSAIARSQSSKSDVYASYPLVQVLENPSLPEGPTSPNRMLVYLAGIAAMMMMLLGLFLGWIRSALLSRLMTKPNSSS